MATLREVGGCGSSAGISRGWRGPWPLAAGADPRAGPRGEASWWRPALLIRAADSPREKYGDGALCPRPPRPPPAASCPRPAGNCRAAQSGSRRRRRRRTPPLPTLPYPDTQPLLHPDPLLETQTLCATVPWNRRYIHTFRGLGKGDGWVGGRTPFFLGGGGIFFYISYIKCQIKSRGWDQCKKNLFEK